jgi:integrase
MLPRSVILEPTFTETISAIGSAIDLSIEKKRHWACSLRQIARWLDRPLETVPARLTSVSLSMSQLHHAALGVTAKTVANHKANVAAALRWFCKEHDVSPRGVPLSDDWGVLWDTIDDRGMKARLSGLMRYCSGCKIAPAAVTDSIFHDYFLYRSRSTALATDIAARRSVARTWNACGEHPAWPLVRLTEPPLKATLGPKWEDFPQGLRRDIEGYLAGLQKTRKAANGKRVRPCGAKAIRTRRAELAATAHMAVRIGIPIDRLTSLTALVHPDVVEPVIEAYWKKNGNEPKIFTIDLGWKLLSIAREVGLDEAAIERLQNVRATLEEYRHSGLTAKNLSLVRKVLTPGIWKSVVLLPEALMREARADLANSPVKAAVNAQVAAAIAILIYAPVRLGNLVSIELDTNLIKPGGLKATYLLTFPYYDVKNRIDLDFQFDAELTALIDEYIHDFRPHLLRGSNAQCLFPGVAGKPKTPSMFSEQITKRIEDATGLRLTTHQFRHAAAAIYLKYHPGDYETVRRLLGHRSITTTTHIYCGLETTQATAVFGKLMREKIRFDDD